MDSTKKVEVCANCSGFDVRELTDMVKAKIGCIGKCSRKCPELSGKVYGFLNGEFEACDTKQEFFAKIDALPAYVGTSNANPLVDAFLSHASAWQPEYAELRRIVLDCGLTEELKWSQPCYTCQNKNVLMLGGFKRYIAIAFFKGELLKDPQHILVQQTENVQSARQIRFTGVDQIGEMEETIKAYVREAIEVERSGLTAPEAKRPELEIPEELQRKFEKLPAFKAAFFALTPGRQRAYILHFSQPKQSVTREARIEKNIPRILEGIGLND